MSNTSVTTTSQIQERFLNDLLKRKAPVAVYLKNGIKLKGIILGFDEFSIILDHPSMQIVYKTAISTIAPLITLFSEDNYPS